MSLADELLAADRATTMTPDPESCVVWILDEVDRRRLRDHITELTSQLNEARRERDSFVASFLAVTGQKSDHGAIQSFIEGYRGNSMEEARKKIEGNE